jgi:glucose/arabinose dehydrogenase
MDRSSDADESPASGDDPPSPSRRSVLESSALLGALALVPVGSGASNTASESRTTHSGTAAIPEGPTVETERVAEGLSAPLSLEEPPGGGELHVVDQTGEVRVHDGDGLRETPFLDVSDRMVSLNGSYDERGLLGFAFHPDFPDDDRVFVRYSAPRTDDTPRGYAHTFVLAEYRTGPDPTTADPDSESRLLTIPQPQSNHNAGAITFGPDGYLYVAVGDGGGGGDTGTGHAEDWYGANAGGNGQDVTENLLGSVLRIDVDGGGEGSYAIPPDNPLVGVSGLDEHYAWGFRNPWGMSFGPDGRLFVADAGERRREEVDVVEAGGNYGWNVREGTDCFDPSSMSDPPENCPDSTPDSVRGGETLRDPIVEYPHRSNGDVVGLAIVGGYRSNSTGVDALNGAYVFGDWSRSYESPAGRMFAAIPDGNGGWSMRTVTPAGSADGTLGGFLLGFGQDDAGRIYALTSGESGPTGNSGVVLRIGSTGDGDGGDGDEGGGGNGDDGDGGDGDDGDGGDGDGGDGGDGDGDDGDDDRPEPGEPVETLEFEGRVSAWTGTAPVQLEDVENPTLTLVSGETYRVEWENADGIPHDFQVLDGAGSVLVETEDVSQQGGTASTDFVATEDMAEYRCSYHPTSQRGSVTVRSEPKTVPGAIAGPDGTIGTVELQAAIRLWTTGNPVPETGGETVTTPMLQEVIRAWTTGEVVGN